MCINKMKCNEAEGISFPEKLTCIRAGGWGVSGEPLSSGPSPPTPTPWLHRLKKVTRQRARVSCWVTPQNSYFFSTYPNSSENIFTFTMSFNQLAMLVSPLHYQCCSWSKCLTKTDKEFKVFSWLKSSGNSSYYN